MLTMCNCKKIKETFKNPALERDCTPRHPQTIIPNNTVWFEENQLSQLQCKTDLSKNDATRLRQDYFSSEKVS
jgi:hypothetical protein